VFSRSELEIQFQIINAISARRPAILVGIHQVGSGMRLEIIPPTYVVGNIRGCLGSYESPNGPFVV
jgi:hypothetical protein